MLRLGASVGLFDRFEVGAVLPVAFAQGSEEAPMIARPNGAPWAGVGDLRVMPKVRLLSLGPVLLGAAMPFTLPIGRRNAFLGAGAPTISPTALAEMQLLPVRLLANAGVAVRGGQSLTNLRVCTATTYGLAAELPLSRKL